MLPPAMLLRLSPWVKQARSVALVGVALLMSLLAGCVVPAASEPDSTDTPDTEQPMPPPTPPEMVPDFVSDRVLAQAAAELRVPLAAISILRFTPEVWSDGCLGLGQANESCLQALVEGWQLEVVHQDQSYFYHTDATGEAIRRSTLTNNLPPSVGDRVLAIAAAESGLPVEQLTITDAEPQVWDGCLGVAGPDTVCTQQAIFGWRTVVEGGDRSWVYHTDMTGDDIRLNDLE
ncbi:MAG: hypothetical protein AAFR26_01885 [Cyanobacteria bacterium J06626_4]